MLFFFVLHASDTNATFSYENQTISMCHLLSLSPSSKYDACTMSEVTCDKFGIVRELKLKNTYSRLQIEWLPPTLTDISLSNQVINRPIDASRLPRDLVFFTAQKCGIRGTFELCKLPRNINSVVLKENAISGNLFLINLPKNLCILDFRGNPIRSVYVHFSSLPAKFNCASFTEKHRGVPLVIKSIDTADRVPPVFHIYKNGVYGTPYVYKG